METVTRVEKIQFKSNPEIDKISALAHASKNLFNYANYFMRQRFFENDKLYRETKQSGELLLYNDLYDMVKESEPYRAFVNIAGGTAACAQQTLKLLDKAWKSYRREHADWFKHPEKYLAEPRIPKYKRKNGEHIVVFTNQRCKIINGILKFPKKVHFQLKTRLNNVDLRQVRIIPNGVNYTCEIVYDKEIDPVEIISSRYIGIDPGVRNVVTIANNFGAKPIIVKGGVAKSMGQFYNKEKARIQSIYAKLKDERGRKLKYGNALRKLDWKRNNKFNDYCHKLSRMIVDYAFENNVSTIVIGKNPLWKQESEMSKRNNQQFVQFPHARVIEMIEYKAQELGVKVILQEESHTSKCSFLDLESIEHHDKYIGRRNGGLFKSAKKIKINADVNGALNIIRKAVPEAFADGIEGIGLYPRRCYI